MVRVQKGNKIQTEFAIEICENFQPDLKKKEAEGVVARR